MSAGAGGATGSAGVTAGAQAAGTSGAAGASGSAAGSGGAGSGGAGAAGRAGVSGAAGATPPRAGAASDDDAGAPPQVDAGAPPTTSSKATFSDSFEQGAALDTNTYEVVAKDCMGTGMATLDASMGHTGSHSLKIQGGGGYCNHVFVRPKKLTNALPAPFYARVYVKLMTALTGNHVTFAAVHDQHEDKDLRLGGQMQVLIWNRESDDATLPELSPTGVMQSAKLAPGEWHCLEWSIDASMKKLETWLDDKPVPGLTADSQATPDIDTQWIRKADWQPQPIDVRLGWESYGNDTNTVWFDDIAFGSERLHCTP